jgi:hypothetical protein
MSDNYFRILSDIDVSQHVKQKGQFSYLSWPFAIQTLGEHHPDAEIAVKRFILPDNPDVEVPYMQTPLGYFVEVAVTIGNVTRSQIHPVLDYQNQPVDKPTNFHINTSLQRCLVKAIALHGLGLFVYQGEDLPINAPDYTEEQFEIFNELIAEGDELGLYVFSQNIPLNAAIALHNSFPKGQKGKMKELVNKMLDKGKVIIDQYVDEAGRAIRTDDVTALKELINEAGDAAKRIIWLSLDNELQQAARDMLK